MSPLAIGTGIGIPFGGGSFPHLKLDMDFRTPQSVTKCSTAASVASALGVTTSHVKEIWLCDETSGSLVGEVNGYTLSPFSSVAYNRTAVGLYNGTDFSSLKAVESVDGANGYFQDADKTHLDDDGVTSRAIFFVFRTVGDTPITSAQGILNKGSTKYYKVQWTSSGGLNPVLYDGTTVKSAPTSKSYNDGGWHYACIVINRTDNTMKLFTEFETTSVDISAVGSVSDPAVGFVIMPPTQTNGLQFAYMVAIEGSSAEDITKSALDSFWPHAQDPQPNTPTSPNFTTYSRSSLVQPIVEDDATFGVRVAPYGVDQFAHAYNANFSHSSKVGMLSEEARTNLCLYSEDFTDASWTTSNASVTANQAEAPDGSYTADSISASANAGYVQQAITTSASTAYAQTVFLKRNSASDVAGRLVMYDISNGAELAATSFTATSKWQRIKVLASTIAGGISTGLRIEITTSGDSIYVWGAQLEAGAYATSYIHTISATATRATIVATLDNSNRKYENLDRLEVETTYSFLEDFTTTLSSCSTLIDNRRFNLESRFVLNHGVSSSLFYNRFVLYDESANLVIGAWQREVVIPENERVLRVRIDSQNKISGHTKYADNFVDGVRSDLPPSSPWTAGEPPVNPELQFAIAYSGLLPLNGILVRARIWDRPRADNV